MKLPISFILHFTLALLLMQSLHAQDPQEALNFPSPQASDLGTYGIVPVNKFTGVPNVDIPLFEVQNGDATLPVGLSYHTANVQANRHPGWTGLGWSLRAGGVITRVQRGYPDEMRDTRDIGFLYNYGSLNVSDWSSNTRLKQYSADYASINTRRDAMADEFIFNFAGYTGKFYRGHDGQWHVVSDHKIKVVFSNTGGLAS